MSIHEFSVLAPCTAHEENKVTAGTVWQLNMLRVGNKCTGSKKVVPREFVPHVGERSCVSADLDPSRFWIPYDVTHCLGMRSSLKCRKVTYKMCVAHPRKWIRFLLAGTVLADLDGQKLRFCERRLNLRG